MAVYRGIKKKKNNCHNNASQASGNAPLLNLWLEGSWYEIETVEVIANHPATCPYGARRVLCTGNCCSNLFIPCHHSVFLIFLFPFSIVHILLFICLSDSLTPHPPFSLLTHSVCKAAKADLVFLVDGSWSIGDDNFHKIIRFLHSTTGALDQIGPDGTQVSKRNRGTQRSSPDRNRHKEGRMETGVAAHWFDSPVLIGQTLIATWLNLFFLLSSLPAVDT